MIKMNTELTEAWLSNLETLFIEKGSEWLRAELTHMTRMSKAKIVSDEIGKSDKNERETVYRICSEIGLSIEIEVIETDISTILITWLGTNCRIKTKEKNPRTYAQGFPK